MPFAMLCFLLFGIGGVLYEASAPFLDAMARLLLTVNAGFGLGGAAAVDVVRPPLWLTIVLLGGGFLQHQRPACFCACVNSTGRFFAAAC